MQLTFEQRVVKTAVTTTKIGQQCKDKLATLVHK